MLGIKIQQGGKACGWGGSPRTPVGCEERGQRQHTVTSSSVARHGDFLGAPLLFCNLSVPASMAPCLLPELRLPELLSSDPADSLLEKWIWKIRRSCNCWPEAEGIIPGKGRAKRPAGARVLPEILARVLDFWHPWKASPCFQGAVGKPAGLQALEEKADGGRRREEGSGASQAQTSPDTLGLLPLVLDARIFGAGPSLPGLVWKRTHGRTGRPRCPRHRDQGDRRESRRGAPHPCAKPASPFPSLLRFPSEATDFLLSIPARWRASALPRSSKQGAGFGPSLCLPRAPPCPRARAAHLLPEKSQPYLAWLFAACFAFPCVPLLRVFCHFYLPASPYGVGAQAERRLPGRG